MFEGLTFASELCNEGGSQWWPNICQSPEWPFKAKCGFIPLRSTEWSTRTVDTGQNNELCHRKPSLGHVP
jgi:hypothetical protein